MASFGVYLDSISLPIVQRVLVGLGFGTVTYVGLQAAFDSLKNIVITNYNSIPSTMASLFYLAGFNYSLGIILSAYTMRISMIAVKKFAQVQ